MKNFIWLGILFIFLVAGSFVALAQETTINEQDVTEKVEIKPVAIDVPATASQRGTFESLLSIKNKEKEQMSREEQRHREIMNVLIQIRDELKK